MVKTPGDAKELPGSSDTFLCTAMVLLQPSRPARMVGRSGGRWQALTAELGVHCFPASPEQRCMQPAQGGFWLQQLAFGP